MSCGGKKNTRRRKRRETGVRVDDGFVEVAMNFAVVTKPWDISHGLQPILPFFEKLICQRRDV